MSLRDELKGIDEQIQVLEARRAEIYRASVEAPAEEKVCEDWLAEMLGERGERPKREPILVQAMNASGDVARGAASPLARYQPGAWVAVRPCDQESGGKTFLGVYLGEIALGLSTSYHRESGVLTIGRCMYNPAIWVPDLKRIVFGAGSWWGVIKGPEDMRKITDADINNTWYVKALKDLGGALPPAEAS
ncbi:hypothetical protein WMF30_00900 [Sorangium sp. So ce134]